MDGLFALYRQKFQKVYPYRPQDFSHGRRVVNYPKACIRLRFSDRFRDRRSISARHTLPGHCRSDSPALIADTYCQQSHSPQRCSRWKSEYYGAAEPLVRCGESHLSGLTEPPIDSYSAWTGLRPYTSRMERSFDGSMLSMLILYESYEIRSMMASARVLSPLHIC